MTNPTSTRPQALITGASSGIGAAFAERLARDGYDVVLVARRRDRLQDLAGRMAQEHSITAEVLVADLTQQDQLKTVEQRIEELKALTLLINNAGFGGYMPFISLEPDRAEELIRLHIVALTRLTRAALPGFVARGRGAVINVSSRLAFSGPLAAPTLPKRATYAACKSFINTFSQILAAELEGTGVRVQALCPGLVQTEFHDHVGADPRSFPPAIVMSAKDLVDASLKGLERGEVICVPALEDLTLLKNIEDSQRQFFEQSRTGAVAGRYKE
jgi:hypothetical protein